MINKRVGMQCAGGTLVSILLLLLAGCGSSAPPSSAGTSPTVATSSPKAASTVASLTTVLSQVTAASTIQSVPANLEPTLQRASVDNGYAIMARGCAAGPQTTSIDVASCTYGDVTGKHTVVILGDSHAAMWLPAFDLIGKRAGWRVIDLNKVNCGAADIEYFLQTANRPYPECDTWHSWAIGEINKLDPSLVVLTSHVSKGISVPAPLSAATWTSGLDKTLGLISSPGTKKVILGDAPYLTAVTAGGGTTPQAPANCVAAHEGSVQSCSVPVGDAVSGGYHTAEVTAAQSAGVPYIDVVSWFCSTECTAIVGNKLVYSDLYHITKTYAEYLSGVLGDSVQTEMTGSSAR